MTVHPRPVSPFNWTVSVSDADAHHVAHVNLRRSEARRTEPEDGFLARLDAAYLPLTDARWEVRTRYGDSPQLRALVRDAWTSPGLAFYRWFADLPAFDGVTAGSTCVWFTDLRFMTPGRAAVPFRYGACRDGPQDRWRPYQRIGAQDRVALD